MDLSEFPKLLGVRVFSTSTNQYMNKISKLSSVALAAAALPCIGFSAIIVESEAAVGVVSSNTVTATQSFNFAASSDSVFLVALGVKARDNNAPTSVTLDPTNLNIGLTELARVATDGDDSKYLGIYGADIGSISAGSLDFEVEVVGEGRWQSIAYQLTGADLSARQTVTNAAINPDLDLTNVSAGSFVLSSVFNNSNNAGAEDGWTADNGVLELNANNATTNSGYLNNVIGGNTSVGWGPAGATDIDGAAAAVAIAPVPEPSTYALIAGFLALGGVMIRRRLRK